MYLNVKIHHYIAFRQMASRKIINVIEPIYAKMIEIEKMDGMEASLEYFEDFLYE